jgi:sulfatase modifying factor 1
LTKEGQADWQQPTKEWDQSDEHPVVMISWNKAKEFCQWLSAKTGREWRLPTNREWDAAVGTMQYPWGGHFPPTAEDGNYSILEDGKADPAKAGEDGIKGTAPVASFKPNALGFYDLGGNVWEWMWDGLIESTGDRVLRGASWGNNDPRNCCSSYRYSYNPGHGNGGNGF